MIEEEDKSSSARSSKNGQTNNNNRLLVILEKFCIIIGKKVRYQSVGDWHYSDCTEVTSHRVAKVPS